MMEVKSAMSSAFLFLCKLAWEARYRIPLIITVAFMAFDVRMQVEINVMTRTIRRRHRQQVAEQEQNVLPDDGDDISEDSWLTVEEETDTDSN